MANILIVDDNKSLQQQYAVFLQHEGHQITTASSVDEALQYLAANTPDLILLDMLLPKVNGLELLQKYDVLNTHKNVKVIAFSNFSESEIQDEAQSLGVSLYLNKLQVTPEDLISSIQSVLGSQQSVQQPAAAVPPAAS